MAGSDVVSSMGRVKGHDWTKLPQALPHSVAVVALRSSGDRRTRSSTWAGTGRWRPNGHLVEWGSVTKVVTAQATAQLVASGELDYDMTVGAVLPSSAIDGVTVGELVDHRAGLPTMHPRAAVGVLADPTRPFDRATGPQQFLTVLPPPQQRGQYVYSNAGYAVLGMVIERVTGLPWWAAVRSLLSEDLLPAEVLPDASDPHRALHRNVPWGRRRRPWRLSNGPYAAAGGLWSPLPTLAQFAAGQLATGLPFAARSGWHRAEGGAWCTGRTRDSDIAVVVSRTPDWAVAVHALHRRPGYALGFARRVITGLDDAA